MTPDHDVDAGNTAENEAVQGGALLINLVQELHRLRETEASNCVPPCPAEGDGAVAKAAMWRWMAQVRGSLGNGSLPTVAPC